MQRLAPGRSGEAAAAHGVHRKSRGQGVAAGRGCLGGCCRCQRKIPFILPSMLPLLSSPLASFVSSLHSLGAGLHRPDCLAASSGVGTSRLHRPSIRAGATTRHPMLSVSFDDPWKACRRRPHLSDGFFAGPGSATGCLRQHQGRSLTQHRNTAYAALSAAPSGKTPVLRKRQRAMSNVRATATMPMRLKRLPPLPKRSRGEAARQKTC
jgi:hypothetical protein